MKKTNLYLLTVCTLFLGSLTPLMPSSLRAEVLCNKNHETSEGNFRSDLIKAIKSKDQTQTTGLLEKLKEDHKSTAAALRPDGPHYQPLLLAVFGGDIQMTTLLLDYGAGELINTPTGHPDHTPLDCAVKSGNKGLVRLLLENGASPSILMPNNDKGETPIFVATKLRESEILALLLSFKEAKTALIVPNKNGLLPINYAVEKEKNAHEWAKDSWQRVINLLQHTTKENSV